MTPFSNKQAPEASSPTATPRATRPGAIEDGRAVAATTTGCTGTKITVSGGQATVTIPANNAVAIHVNAKADITKIATTFNVTADLESGQTLHVVGNIPALGGGSTANSVALTANGDGTYKTIAELPASTAVSYKYLIKNGATVVEQEAANRTFTTPANGTHTSNDTWK
ncbi:carbohydrate-binding module family 20 domain-containing protein [Streptosporangium sp. NPDC001681]|uniref:carbohydrate-binding module family 20 domain-containing protein n=1 Tax=Streptosporangium sp. NPDC001681 TaxID=3154395 RepID=UPI003327F61E